jgi:hypothetical protein
MQEEIKTPKRSLTMKAIAIINSFVPGILLVLLTLSPAFAAERVALQAGPDMRGAQGEAVISDAGSGNKEVVITAQGLKPNEVYTVWLVNMKPKMAMAGLGSGDYSFTSDASGKGRYTSTVSAAELGKWQQLKIAHHPDRNPQNMKNIGSALEGNLK